MLPLLVGGMMALRVSAGEPVAVTEKILTLPWLRSMESQEYDFRFGNCPINSIAGTERRVFNIGRFKECLKTLHWHFSTSGKQQTKKCML